MAGRPTKMTPEVQDKILTALRAGNFRQVAAQYAGISQRTLREWMQQGERRPKSAHGRFRRQLIEAEKSAEMRMVAMVMKAATGDARHAEWWLERKANARWGRERHEKEKEAVAHAVKEELLSHLSAAELLAIVARGKADEAPRPVSSEH